MSKPLIIKKSGEVFVQLGIFYLTAMMLKVVFIETIWVLMTVLSITVGVFFVVSGIYLINWATNLEDKQMQRNKKRKSIKLLKNTVVTFEET